MKKLALVLAVLLSTQGSAMELSVESVEVTPEEPVEDQEFTVEVVAEGDSIDTVETRLNSSEWDYKECNIHLSCEKSWSYSIEEPGEYLLEARATHDLRTSEVVSTVIEVQEEDLKPNAVLEIEPSPAIVGDQVVFDASNSQSNDGTQIEFYRFKINSENQFITLEEPTISEVFEEPKKGNAIVEVETEAGNTGRTNKSFEVLEEETSQLYLNVEDKDGNPLNASFILENDQTYEGYTGDDGSRVIEVLKDSYDLTVTKEGYKTELEKIEISEGETKEKSVILREETRDIDKGTLKVHTIDDIEENLGGVEVTVENSQTETKTSDYAGKTEFLLEEGQYQVYAEKEGFYPGSKTVRVNANETEETQLKLGKKPGFEILEFESPSTVCSGDEFRIDFVTENNRQMSESVRMSAAIPGFEEVSREITVAPESRTSSYLTFPGIREEGVHTITLNIGNGDSHQKTNQIFVKDCEDRAETEASALSLNTDRTKVQIGETVELSGYLEGYEGSTDIDIFLGDDDETTITTNRNGYYSTKISPDTVGSVKIAVSGKGLSQSKTIDVLPTAAINSMRIDSTPYAGHLFEVCGEVETQQNAKVILKREGEAIDSKTSNRETCFEVREQDPGNYRYTMKATARGGTDSKTRSFTVHPSQEEVSSFPQQIAMERSGPGELNVDLYNNGQTAANYETEISGIPDHYVDQTRKSTRLSPGRSKTKYFFLTPTEEGEFTPKVTVKRDGETIFEEEKRMTSGGTTQQHTRTIFERFRNWIRIV